MKDNTIESVITADQVGAVIVSVDERRPNGMPPADQFEGAVICEVEKGYAANVRPDGVMTPALIWTDGDGRHGVAHFPHCFAGYHVDARNKAVERVLSDAGAVLAAFCAEDYEGAEEVEIVVLFVRGGGSTTSYTTTPRLDGWLKAEGDWGPLVDAMRGGMAP